MTYYHYHHKRPFQPAYVVIRYETLRLAVCLALVVGLFANE